MFELIESLSLVAGVVLALLLSFVPVGVYLVARWREDHGGPRDPNLGLATVFGLFAYLGAVLFVAGLELLVSVPLSGGGEYQMGWKLPLALLLSGLVVVVPSWFALRPFLPSRAARLYGGLVLLGAGLTLVIALTSLVFTIVMGGGRVGNILALIIVNLPIVIVGAMRMARPRSLEAPPTGT